MFSPMPLETKAKKETPGARSLINKILHKSVGNKKLLTDESERGFMKPKHLLPIEQAEAELWFINFK